MVGASASPGTKTPSAPAAAYVRSRRTASSSNAAGSPRVRRYTSVRAFTKKGTSFAAATSRMATIRAAEADADVAEAAGVADEAAHVLAGGAQLVYDVPADEAAAAGDEDHFFASSAKFCQ